MRSVLLSRAAVLIHSIMFFHQPLLTLECIRLFPESLQRFFAFLLFVAVIFRRSHHFLVRFSNHVFPPPVLLHMHHNSFQAYVLPWLPLTAYPLFFAALLLSFLCTACCNTLFLRLWHQTFCHTSRIFSRRSHA